MAAKRNPINVGKGITVTATYKRINIAADPNVCESVEEAASEDTLMKLRQALTKEKR